MSSRLEGSLTIPNADSAIREDAEQRVARLTTLLHELQAHTDALYELAKKAETRAGKAITRADATMLRAGSGRVRRSR
jgi:hypothetical protein